VRVRPQAPPLGGSHAALATGSEAPQSTTSIRRPARASGPADSGRRQGPPEPPVRLFGDAPLRRLRGVDANTSLTCDDARYPQRDSNPCCRLERAERPWFVTFGVDAKPLVEADICLPLEPTQDTTYHLLRARIAHESRTAQSGHSPLASLENSIARVSGLRGAGGSPRISVVTGGHCRDTSDSQARPGRPLSGHRTMTETPCDEPGRSGAAVACHHVEELHRATTR
jgi:hypothetical protein